MSARSISPIKIVHVGVFFFSHKKKSPAPFSNGGKISQGFIRNGHCVIEIPYREMIQGVDIPLWGKWQKKHFFKKLLSFLISIKADLLILGHCYNIISGDDIYLLRQKCPGMKIMQWNVDGIFVNSNYDNFLERAKKVDASFMTTAPENFIKNYKDLNIFFFPNIIDSSVEKNRNFEKDNLKYDLFMSYGSDRDQRLILEKWWTISEFISEIKRSTKARIIEVGGRNYQQGAAYEKMLTQASMSINISRRSDYLLYSSDRLSHLLGNGLLVFMEAITGYQKFFSQEEMIFFSDMEELFDKIIFFKNNHKERCLIAHNGYKKAHKIFNEKVVTRYMLDIIFNNKNRQFYEEQTLLF